jgi:hypothetical protein
LSFDPGVYIDENSINTRLSPKNHNHQNENENDVRDHRNAAVDGVSAHFESTVSTFV